MRKVGRIHTARVSGAMLASALAFALIFAGAAIWSINRYAALYFENQDLRVQVDEMADTLDEYRYQAQVLDQYERLADELGQTSTNGEAAEAPAEEPVPDDGTMTARPIEIEKADDEEAGVGGEEGEGGEETVAAAEAESEAAVEPEPVPNPNPPENPPVDAVRLALRPENGDTGIRFQYSLQNIQAGNKVVSGYLFIVLTDEKTEPARMVPYPEVEIKAGMPVDFKKGLQFSIRRGKIVRGRIKKLERASDFNRAWIFAYSEKGELIMAKLLPTKNG